MRRNGHLGPQTGSCLPLRASERLSWGPGSWGAGQGWYPSGGRSGCTQPNGRVLCPPREGLPWAVGKPSRPRPRPRLEDIRTLRSTRPALPSGTQSPLRFQALGCCLHAEHTCVTPACLPSPTCDCVLRCLQFFRQVVMATPLGFSPRDPRASSQSCGARPGTLAGKLRPTTPPHPPQPGLGWS